MKNLFFKFKLTIFSLSLFFMSFSCNEETEHTSISEEDTTTSMRAQIASPGAKWAVTSGYASSEELIGEGSNNGAFKFSYDGTAATFWHSKWYDGADALPVTGTWTLEEGADKLDYILYTPRGENANGNGTWEKIDVYISTTSSPDTFTKAISDFNCAAVGYPTKIDFTTPILNPKNVRIVITQGRGGFASCGEVGFYKEEVLNAPFKELEMGNVGFVEPDLYANDANGARMMLRETTTENNIRGKVFFKFEEAGTVRMDLYIKNEHANKKLKIKLNEFDAIVDIPVTMGYEWVKITESFFNAAPSYSCMEIQNTTSGDVFIEKLRIIGDASNGVSFNDRENKRRNSVSVHLGYPVNGLSNIEWFYNEVTIPQGFDKPYHSFYMTNGWYLGYSGIQTRDVVGANSSRMLIFSCWNSKETEDQNYWAKVVKKGNGVGASSFGGEGTGAKTRIDNFEWEAGKTYSFLLNARVSTAVPGSTMQQTDTTYYSLFWKEKEATDWNFQATIMSPYNGRYLYGLYSFVENYWGTDGQHQRKALYHNQWVKGAAGWTELLTANFTADGGEKYRNDIGAGVDGAGYFLWNGGFIENEGWPGDKFTRESSATIPVSEAKLAELELIAR